MHKRIALVVLLATVAVVLVVIAPISAVSKPQTITLRGLPDRFEPVGFTAEGHATTGSQAVIVERLHTLEGNKVGARVGQADILCTVTGVWKGSHRSPAYCTASYSLPGGKIVVAGFGPSPVGPKGAVIAIVGGTGKYANARGWVKVSDLPGFRTNNEIHLMP